MGVPLTHNLSCHLTACVTVLMLFPMGSGAQTPATSSHVATSFDGLRTLLRPGNEVIVTDPSGKPTRGKIGTVTTSSLDLTIETTRLLVLRKYDQRSFAETGVATVKRVDSTANGAIIGIAAVLGPIILVPCPDNADGSCSVGKVFGALLLVPLGAAIGGFVDSRLNETVYRRGPPAGRVTISLFSVQSRTYGASLNLRF